MGKIAFASEASSMYHHCSFFVGDSIFQMAVCISWGISFVLKAVFVHLEYKIASVVNQEVGG